MNCNQTEKLVNRCRLHDRGDTRNYTRHRSIVTDGKFIYTAERTRLLIFFNTRSNKMVTAGNIETHEFQPPPLRERGNFSLIFAVHLGLLSNVSEFPYTLSSSNIIRTQDGMNFRMLQRTDSHTYIDIYRV